MREFWKRSFKEHLYLTLLEKVKANKGPYFQGLDAGILEVWAAQLADDGLHPVLASVLLRQITVWDVGGE